MRGKVTKRSVDAMRPGAGVLFLWDLELRGFGVRITPAGIRSFVLQWERGGRGGRARRFTIGRYGEWTAEKARTEARRLLGDVSKGLDPAEARQEGNRAPTLKEFSERYLAEHARAKKKRGPRTRTRGSSKP